MRVRLVLVLGLCLGHACLATALGAAAGVDPVDSIRAKELLADVSVLSSERLAGRLSGTAGYDSACAWAAARFAALGARPGGDGGGWLQRFTTEVNVIDGARLAVLCDGQLTREGVPGEDFICRGFTGAGEVVAPVVFAGYGLSLPDQGWDDYADLDVEGKAVLVFKQPPAWRPPRGDWSEAHLPRPKAAAAVARGAVALLMVSLSDSVQGGQPIGSVMHGPGPQVAIPQLHIGRAFAGELLAGGGASLDELRRLIDAERRPASRPLTRAVAISVKSSYAEAATTANVVALWPGRDAQLAGEAVIVGAHLDHVGMQGELLFPGANDNASGVAALLAVARAFAVGGPARRTVVFALFAGEEQGLIGARQLAARPPVPLEDVVAMINLDCVAQGDSIQLGGGTTSPRLWALARALDEKGARRTVARTWGGGGADATPFHEAGVPTLYFAATNGYRHLHRPTDTVETLDGSLHEEVARLVYRTARVVAEGSYPGESGEQGR